ncbi:hypothetical protein CYMTET_16291 [Cymbomonas tetramitiformis]|uniref:Uncharacterized protein n=1 Tax=Cymbomonas tetramitiformis TaxID=36881 RepID=A0AAE0GCI3_9CHLO|nr:hypothetical protein CYMTET_16291 [Cymbomonas tetramitiformis]
MCECRVAISRLLRATVLLALQGKVLTTSEAPRVSQNFIARRVVEEEGYSNLVGSREGFKLYTNVADKGLIETLQVTYRDGLFVAGEKVITESDHLRVLDDLERTQAKLQALETRLQILEAQHPPTCVVPGGDRLQFNRTGWVCVCNAGYHGAYKISVDIFNIEARGTIHFGHPGIGYNAQDDDNYEVVYFRPRDNNHQTGQLVSGQVQWTSETSNSVEVVGGVWFHVEVHIADRTATIYKDGQLVGTQPTYFDPVARGVMLVANGYDNNVHFKNFKIVLEEGCRTIEPTGPPSE